MIESLVGSATAEKVLLFMENYGEGYGSLIANNFDISISQVQKQLDRFERGGLFVSQKVGRTRLYKWNPRNPINKYIRQMLREILTQYPKTELKKYYRNRTRPRRKGKPL